MNERQRDELDSEESIEELIEDASIENPDPTTRREVYELDLMAELRSEEGAEFAVDAPDESDIG